MRGIMQKSFVAVLLALLLLLPFQNCGVRLGALTGTETGNAMAPRDSGNQPILSRTIAASNLVSRMCDTQVACDPSISKDSCVERLAAVEGLPQKFGIDAGTGITTMQELATAEEQGIYLPSANATSACESELKAMTCSVAVPMSSAAPGAALGSAVGAALATSPSCETVY